MFRKLFACETKNCDRNYNRGGVENKLVLILAELSFDACEITAEWEQPQVQNIDTTPRVGCETSAGKCGGTRFHSVDALKL